MIEHDILRIALEQSAIDCGCSTADFFQKNPVVRETPAYDARVRQYIRRPQMCDMVSYGGNVVAVAAPAVLPCVRQYLTSCPAAHCFETPQILRLNELLKPFELKICYMAEYFLPAARSLPALSCDYEMRTLQRGEFDELYRQEWSNALCADRKEADALCVGAYDGGKLIGLAGCSADCDTMWQIGVDVLPEYRRQNVAAALTSSLAAQTFARGKIPFYCAAWCNLPSVRNALKCGFLPAWVQMSAMPADFVATAIKAWNIG